MWQRESLLHLTSVSVRKDAKMILVRTRPHRDMAKSLFHHHLVDTVYIEHQQTRNKHGSLSRLLYFSFFSLCISVGVELVVYPHLISNPWFPFLSLLCSGMTGLCHQSCAGPLLHSSSHHEHKAIYTHSTPDKTSLRGVQGQCFDV